MLQALKNKCIKMKGEVGIVVQKYIGKRIAGMIRCMLCPYTLFM